MADLSNMKLFHLVVRLNEIEKEKQDIYLRNAHNNHDLAELDKEYDEIVYELWRRIPSLKDDVNIQPKTKVRRRERND